MTKRGKKIFERKRTMGVVDRTKEKLYQEAYDVVESRMFDKPEELEAQQLVLNHLKQFC